MPALATIPRDGLFRRTAAGFRAGLHPRLHAGLHRRRLAPGPLARRRTGGCPGPSPHRAPAEPTGRSWKDAARIQEGWARPTAFPAKGAGAPQGHLRHRHPGRRGRRKAFTRRRAGARAQEKEGGGGGIPRGGGGASIPGGGGGASNEGGGGGAAGPPFGRSLNTGTSGAGGLGCRAGPGGSGIGSGTGGAYDSPAEGAGAACCAGSSARFSFGFRRSRPPPSASPPPDGGAGGGGGGSGADGGPPAEGGRGFNRSGWDSSLIGWELNDLTDKTRNQKDSLAVPPRRSSAYPFSP